MEGNLRFQIDWASLIVGSKFTVFPSFYFVFEGNFPSRSPRVAYIWRDVGFFALPGWRAYIWRGLYMEGLIFGILRYFKTLRNGPAPGIEPSTFHSAVKRSTDWANPASPKSGIYTEVESKDVKSKTYTRSLRVTTHRFVSFVIDIYNSSLLLEGINAAGNICWPGLRYFDAKFEQRN